MRSTERRMPTTGWSMTWAMTSSVAPCLAAEAVNLIPVLYPKTMRVGGSSGTLHRPPSSPCQRRHRDPPRIVHPPGTPPTPLPSRRRLSLLALLSPNRPPCPSSPVRSRFANIEKDFQHTLALLVR
jgi:hypothetical protein